MLHYNTVCTSVSIQHTHFIFCVILYLTSDFWSVCGGSDTLLFWGERERDRGNFHFFGGGGVLGYF